MPLCIARSPRFLVAWCVCAVLALATCAQGFLIGRLAALKPLMMTGLPRR